MSEDFPYSAEYAKTGRSACKTCGGAIPKDHMRIGPLVQSQHFDGKMALWNHFNCFFRKNNVKSTGDIKGFGTLRYEDQSKIKEKVVSGGLASAGKGKSVSVDVEVQYAKSSVSTCNGCFVKIEKSALRIGCWVAAEGKELMWAKNGKKQAWHHPKCFVERKRELDIDQTVTGDVLAGFDSLKPEDQAQLLILLGKSKPGKRKKRAASANNENKPPITEKDRQLMAQSNYLMEIRQALKEVNNKYLRQMLEINGYPTHGLDIRLIDRSSDGIAFGRFNDPCSICEETYFSLGSDSYVCKGDVSQFTKCTNKIVDPKRVKWVIPDSVKEQSGYLANLKLKTGKRLFNVADASTVETDGASPGLPLKDYVFCSTLENLNLDGTEYDIKSLIEKSGGRVHKKFTAKCNALVTDDVGNGKRLVKRAISLEIPIVDSQKLVKGLLANSLSDVSSICFSGYEGEDYIKKRRSVASLKASHKREKSGIEQGSSKRAKITVQNGAEVFHESGMSGRKDVQVYKDLNGVVYAATLGQVDLAAGKNSYYKLQILKLREHRYELFRAWGRIGTDIGGTTTDEFHSYVGAVDLFKFHYREKTGNEWGKPFQKIAGRMYRIDLDYGGADDETATVKPGTLTKLHQGIQALIQLIFDINAMKDTLSEFEIDLNKMPLGKLSRSQIREAFSVLGAANELLSEADSNRIQILDASTKFYTLIPHDFGMASPPLLNNRDLISTKTKMLETLLELEIAYSMTRTDVADKDKDPIDTHFMKLNSDISVLDSASQEFTLLRDYVSTTHADTHNMFTLDIVNIFKVDRQGESARYAKFGKLQNRMLLWHGSRISNFAGILSQGLRIAPPEAPTTGYMFGKGVYFADMVSKSANYCCTTPTNNTGLLLLCEVALGEMYCLKDAQYINKLPKGKHSTKGIGRTAPSTAHTLPSGCVVPMGPGEVQPDTEDSSLLYNEYIVYDINQVNVKYLFQLKFDYGKRRR